MAVSNSPIHKIYSFTAMSAKCQDPSLPAVPVDSGEAEAPAATDPSRVAAMVAAVENFKTKNGHVSGRLLVWSSLSPSKVQQGQEKEVDGHAGEMVLELGRLAQILGIAKSDGRVAKETSCYASQGIKIIFGHKDKAENDDEDGPKDCPGQIATADMFCRIA